MEKNILRKTETNLTVDNIFTTFSKPLNPNCEIVAYYLYTREMCLNSIYSLNGYKDIPSDQIPDELNFNDKNNRRKSVMFEFFDKEGLKEFLYYRKKVDGGILQRFISSKETCNSVIQLVWTPHFCLYEKRTNSLNLEDKRYDFYERACTYEGKEFHSNCCKFK